LLISIIAAMGSNRVIGRCGELPWKLPVDLERFRVITTGHSVIMGRKTYESIGRPLPNRRNIVITRQPGYHAEGSVVVSRLQQALDLAGGEDEVFICGGGEIYLEALPLADRLYLTILATDFEGDTRFPEIPTGQFREVHREQLPEAPGGFFICLERLLTADGAPATVIS
jgi:dihydrofolate reductase